MKPPAGLAGSKNWQVYAGAAAVAAALTAGGYLLGLQPVLERRDAQAALRAELAARRDQAAGATAAMEAARRELARTNDALAGQPLRLQPAAQINQRLAAVAGLANECGLVIDEMQPGVPADSPHYQTVPVRIVGTGTYPSCAHFLHELRGRFPDTAVRSLESLNKNPASEAPLATFSFDLTWFAAPANAPGNPPVGTAAAAAAR